MIIVIEDAGFYAEYSSGGALLSSYRLPDNFTKAKYAEKAPGADRRKFFYGVTGIKQNIPTNPEFDGWPVKIDADALLQRLGVSRETPVAA